MKLTSLEITLTGAFSRERIKYFTKERIVKKYYCKVQIKHGKVLKRNCILMLRKGPICFSKITLRSFLTDPFSLVRNEEKMSL